MAKYRKSHGEQELINIDNYIHEFNGNWVVAQFTNGQYITDMNPRGRKLTGCSQVFSNTLEGVATDPCVTTYKRKSSAIRAFVRDYCLEKSC